MEKQITIEYDGAKYTLAFTRKTVQAISANGFEPDMITKQPANGIPMLFNGAFLAHHRGMLDSKKQQIYESLEGRPELINKLLTMYLEPINAMIEEPTTEKKVKWEANFEE